MPFAGTVTHIAGWRSSLPGGPPAIRAPAGIRPLLERWAEGRTSARRTRSTARSQHDQAARFHSVELGAADLFPLSLGIIRGQLDDPALVRTYRQLELDVAIVRIEEDEHVVHAFGVRTFRRQAQADRRAAFVLPLLLGLFTAARIEPGDARAVAPALAAEDGIVPTQGNQARDELSELIRRFR